METLFKKPAWINNTIESMYFEEFLEAVVTVYVRWREAGLNPGSDYFAVSTRNRLEAEQEVEMKWYRLVADRHGVNSVDYPYHSDWVMRTWVSFRKSGSEEKDELFEHYGMETRTADWKKTKEQD